MFTHTRARSTVNSFQIASNNWILLKMNIKLGTPAVHFVGSVFLWEIKRYLKASLLTLRIDLLWNFGNAALMWDQTHTLVTMCCTFKVATFGGDGPNLFNLDMFDNWIFKKMNDNNFFWIEWNFELNEGPFTNVNIFYIEWNPEVIKWIYVQN